MTADYRIVNATPDDYSAIEKIAHATWPDTFGEILSEEQIAYMLNMMYRREAIEEQVGKGHVFLLLLEMEGAGSGNEYLKGNVIKYKAIGYASYQLNYLSNTTKLHKLYVLPDRQGNGYGKHLIKEITARARKAKQAALRLDVNYQNKAVGMYEHLGFVKIDRFDTDIGNGYLMEDWRMELVF